jgi:hypothetical protein
MFPSSAIAGMLGFGQREYLVEQADKADMPSMKWVPDAQKSKRTDSMLCLIIFPSFIGFLRQIRFNTMDIQAVIYDDGSNVRYHRYGREILTRAQKAIFP